MHFIQGRSVARTAILCALLSGCIAIAQTSTSTLPSAKFLYSSDFTGNKVLGYNVNPSTGAIKATAQGSATTHTGPTRVASDKGGYRLYVINQTSKDLSAYFIYRNTGSLHPVPGSPFKIGVTPTNVAVDPSGKYVYVTTLESTSNPKSDVYAFAVQSNGSLKPVPGSPFSTVNWALAVVIDPQAKYLYVSSSPETITPSAGKIDAYSISSTDGALTPVPGSPYTEPASENCANGGWDVAIHPSGNFLVIPSVCEGMVVYRIERSTGTLSLIKGSPFPVPYPPSPAVESIAMDPAGQYFWVTTQFCESGCSISTDTWKLNTTTGVPTYLESGIGGCGLLARSDPSGKFIYEVGDTTSNTGGCTGTTTPALWGLAINRSSGKLTNISGSPWKSPNSDFFNLDGLAVTP
jgi:6-phosphogluconolactonase